MKGRLGFAVAALAAVAVLAFFYFDGATVKESALQSRYYPLADGGSFDLQAGVVRASVAGRNFNAYAFNGQLPGPVLKVRQGSRATLNFLNGLPEETSIHWHGLRVGNAFDGVPALTQNPVLPGEGFSYELDFPDPGMYWYHPHLQEARQQELGLYGVILVEPEKEDYYGKASREEVLVLDDILLDNGAPTFIEGVTTHALMGRFGNVLLVNGGTGYELPAKTGEVIRFYALNAANTRVFNFKIPGARLKVVGTDVSSFESEYFADSVVIAPSERYVIEAFFEKPGEHALVHETPYGEYSLGRVIVSSENQAATESPSSSFLELKENKYVAAEVGPLKALFGKPVDVDWRLSVELQGHMGHAMSMGLGEDGIEWEDAMGSMNANLTTDSVKWVIQDRATGKENDELQYNFKKGDHVKVRIFNDPKSMHPMQHPIHFHGNRFLVLERDGVENENKAWKDTVLVPSGSAITLFLELSNPGKWMAHCHVSEHLEAGMMAQYGVA